MPELPEVETTIRRIQPHILNRMIEDVWSDAPSLLRNRADVHTFRKEVRGRKIILVTRRGKNILIRLSGQVLRRGQDAEERTMLIHLKMTGHLLLGNWRLAGGRWRATGSELLAEKVNSYIHIMFRLGSRRGDLAGKQGMMMALSDARKFGKAIIFRDSEIAALPDLQIGPEPFAVLFTEFFECIHKQKRKIKQVLLDQKAVAGIGNIYADEILWDAGIHPARRGGDIQLRECRKIFFAMRRILSRAIRAGGTSFSDYRTPEGAPGGFTTRLSVYGKEGEPCPRDGENIQRIVIGGRSAHFCPKHQK